MWLRQNASMQFVSYLPGSTPLVLDSPHSGTRYPPDFGFACELAVLRRAEDTHVEKLYDFAPGLGAAWIEALFPRSYLDVNRGVEEIDVNLIEGPWPVEVSADPKIMSKVRLGKGLIWRCTDEGIDIYDRKLSVAEVEQRIEQGWKPYHAAVALAIDAAHRRHGFSIHIDCHSMPSTASSHATEFPGLAHADFVIGNLDGATSSPALALGLCQRLQERGWDVSYNHPYKGVELVRRYGDPARHRHSIQVEVNRKLYMNEQTLQTHEGFDRLKADMRAMVEWLLTVDPRDL